MSIQTQTASDNLTRAAQPAYQGAVLPRALKWPVIAIVIVGSVHLLAEALLPDLRTIFVPAVLAPLLLAFGIWVGYKAVSFGGNFVHVLIVGAILGLFPLMLDLIGFGILLNRGLNYGELAGVFGFGMIFFGALVGGGFRLSD